jgi:hypothetical protein
MFKLIETAVDFIFLNRNQDMDNYIKSKNPTHISEIEELIRKYPSSTGMYQ